MKTQSVTAAGLLARATRIFIDTAPVIYFVEQHPRYLPLVRPVFDRIDAGALTLVTSPITLAECLVLPLRNGQTDIVELFTELPHSWSVHQVCSRRPAGRCTGGGTPG